MFKVTCSISQKLKYDEGSSPILMQPKLIESIPKFCDKKKIVFIKTHKAGSSTIFNLLARLSKKNKMRFSCVNQFIWPEYFKEDYLKKSKFVYDIFPHHARYSQSTFQKYFPRHETFYFTILRDPYAQWKSSITYFKYNKVLGLRNFNHIKRFLKKGSLNWVKRTRKRFSILNMVKNPSMFDLGFNYIFDDELTKARKYIQLIENEFDFVMLMEHFNESLLILKEMLCLDDDDIIYVTMNENLPSEKNKFNFDADSEIKDLVYQFNKADNLLFKHFQPKFNYLTTFIAKNLKDYEKQLTRAYTTCIKTRKLQEAYTDKFYYGYDVNTNLTIEKHKFCQDLIKNELKFTEELCCSKSTDI